MQILGWKRSKIFKNIQKRSKIFKSFGAAPGKWARGEFVVGGS